MQNAKQSCWCAPGGMFTLGGGPVGLGPQLLRKGYCSAGVDVSVELQWRWFCEGWKNWKLDSTAAAGMHCHFQCENVRLKWHRPKHEADRKYRVSSFSFSLWSLANIPIWHSLTGHQLAKQKCGFQSFRTSQSRFRWLGLKLTDSTSTPSFQWWSRPSTTVINLPCGKEKNARQSTVTGL